MPPSVWRDVQHPGRRGVTVLLNVHDYEQLFRYAMLIHSSVTAAAWELLTDALDEALGHIREVATERQHEPS